MAVTSNRLANQAVYIDAGVGSMDVSSLAQFYPGQLGMVFTKAGKTYQLVQFDSSTSTVAVNNAVAWVDLDDFTVTTDISDTVRNLPAGVALGTQTAGYFGWIQVDGPSTVTDSGQSASAGDSLIMSATDQTVDKVTAGTASTYRPLGTATAAASGGTVAIEIQAPHNGW